MKPYTQYAVAAGVLVLAVAVVLLASQMPLPRDIALAVQTIAAFVGGGSVVGMYRAAIAGRRARRNIS